MKSDSSEEKLDLMISYILIVGVISSVVIESIGIWGYYSSTGNLTILFHPQYALKGADFFSYGANVFGGLAKGRWMPVQVLGLGVVVLMITPYLRVVASVFYFGLVRNLKYLLITLFVLIVLTASLLIH